MEELTIPKNGVQLKARLLNLKNEREQRQERQRQERQSGVRHRPTFPQRVREEVLKKTAGRCHICSGEVGSAWVVDHVQPYNDDGSDELDNLLAAHALCNHYKWDYFPEEIQWMLKIGVWAREQILRNSQLGSEIARGFIDYDVKRDGRRVPN